MSNIKYRIGIILALLIASGYILFPRTVTVRQLTNGAMVDQTIKRVPLRYGLDLQGGMHVALEVDESKGVVADKSRALDNTLKVVRNRVDQFGVSEPVVQKVGNDRIVVELPGIDNPERARQLLQQSAYLEFQITDKTQALEKVMPRLNSIIKEKAPAAAATAGKPAAAAPGASLSLFSNADSAKKTTVGVTKNDSAATADSSTLLANLAEGPFSKLVGQGQIPGEYLVAKSDVDRMSQYLAMPEVQAALPPGKVLRWGSDSVAAGTRTYRPLYLLDSRPIITGEYLTDARPNSDPVEGTKVDFTLSNEGGRRFRNETARHIKDNMAIVLDNVVMGRPPVIQSAIGTHGQITMGGRDLQAAQDLSTVLRAGALPTPLKIAETREVGASMGADSVRKGILAGLIAVALVVIIMVTYYKFSGLLAVAGLVLYMVFTLAVLAGFDAVLTLPGLAGFVLSIGIAVDANVLIFERIREELDRGKTVRVSIDEGFRHALPAIIDSNVSTALTAAVLYQYGTGPVRGFAVTLLAGIAASMVTAIFVVRTFYLVWLDRSRGAAQTLSI